MDIFILQDAKERDKWMQEMKKELKKLQVLSLIKFLQTLF
jgi:hypothetical protein